jgi:hypothetical protein
MYGEVWRNVKLWEEVYALQNKTGHWRERYKKSNAKIRGKQKKKNNDERKQATHSLSQHACVILSCTINSIYRGRSIELITKH